VGDFLVEKHKAVVVFSVKPLDGGVNRERPQNIITLISINAMQSAEDFSGD
jgi:hypothetical protein